jgi:enamine deaminase RidA (YjgF/YER057c/UK114 family)
MQRIKISSGSSFEKEIGYSRGLKVGNTIYISGTTGYNYATMQIDEDVAKQTEQCILNIEKALSDAGATLADIVKLTYILPNADDFKLCWPNLKKYFGETRPAATMISAGLADDKMKIEIEAIAIIQD